MPQINTQSTPQKYASAVPNVQPLPPTALNATEAVTIADR